MDDSFKLFRIGDFLNSGVLYSHRTLRCEITTPRNLLSPLLQCANCAIAFITKAKLLAIRGIACAAILIKSSIL